jgi:hypothetical protein
MLEIRPVEIERGHLGYQARPIGFSDAAAITAFRVQVLARPPRR